MPLRKGSNQAIVSRNIKTLVDDWKKDGAIGTSQPPKEKSDQAGRCHCIGQGRQAPQNVAAQAMHRHSVAILCDRA
jgi:hypothetical protein